MASGAAVSEGLKAAGALLDGASALGAANANARALRTDAANVMNLGAAQVADVRQQARMAAGEAIAAQGTSGFQIGTGSALDVLRETEINAQLDMMRLRTRAQTQYSGLQFQAKMAKREGVFKAINAGLKVAAQIAGGGGG